MKSLLTLYHFPNSLLALPAAILQHSPFKVGLNTQLNHGLLISDPNLVLVNYETVHMQKLMGYGMIICNS